MNTSKTLDALAQTEFVFEGYPYLVKGLETFTKNYTNLGTRNNPMLKLELTYSEFKHFLGQYSQISNASVHILLEFRLRNKFPNVVAAVDKNIEEEKGLYTNGIPHLEFMRSGYMADFSLNTDEVIVTEGTNAFLRKLATLFHTSNSAIGAGAVLAFESIAQEEFRILKQLMSPYNISDKTKKYVWSHIDFEEEHANDLRRAIEPYIDGSNYEQFVQGYTAVLVAFSSWWEYMANDIKLNKLTRV